MRQETNAYVLAGTHERVYVNELQEGDVTTWGEIVESVERVTDNRTVVTMVGGATFVSSSAYSTVIVEKR